MVVTDRDVANSPVILWGSTAKQHYTLACLFFFLEKGLTAAQAGLPPQPLEYWEY